LVNRITTAARNRVRLAYAGFLALSDLLFTEGDKIPNLLSGGLKL
jgi:hypothetical protein